ncbi:hypothetical protein M0802_013906 [Mischocyttarus mexicanus]|nr:hypothetical protein M0802_013906 [Mischocyttarus mexicanus]
MFIRQRKSSDTDESYASEDIEELLEELALDEEEKLNTADNSLENIQWNDFDSRQQSFPFTGKSGLLLDLPSDISPGEVFSIFLNETVISLLVTETNKYAEQKLLEHKTTGHAGQNKWNLTTSEEIKKFIGLMIWMGLVQAPLKKCWSTDRFEELLSNLHFANNETIVKNNRLGKVLPLVDLLTVNYQKVFSPGKEIVVDETMVPWRGRLVFRHYIPTKSHKYGVKLFKLCSTEGYTWSSEIYSGRDTSGKRKVGIAESVSTELADKLLNEECTLFVDNFYTSYELALKFLNSKTHVVGTVRCNKKNMPSFVMSYPLKRGEMVAREDPNGIVVLKWRDVRDVRILSTKHPPIMTPSSNSTYRGRPTKMKPLAIREYNIAESPVSEEEINEFDDKMQHKAATIRHRMRELIYFQEKIGKLQIDMYIRQDMLKKQEDEAKQRAENLAQAERNLEIREEELRKSLGADFSGFRCFGRLQTLVDPLLTLFKTTAITNKILQTSTETSVIGLSKKECQQKSGYYRKEQARRKKPVLRDSNPPYFRNKKAGTLVNFHNEEVQTDCNCTCSQNLQISRFNPLEPLEVGSEAEKEEFVPKATILTPTTDISRRIIRSQYGKQEISS